VLIDRGYSHKQMINRLKISHYRLFRILEDPRLAEIGELRRICRLAGLDFIEVCKYIEYRYWPHERVSKDSD